MQARLVVVRTIPPLVTRRSFPTASLDLPFHKPPLTNRASSSWTRLVTPRKPKRALAFARAIKVRCFASRTPTRSWRAPMLLASGAFPKRNATAEILLARRPAIPASGCVLLRFRCSRTLSTLRSGSGPSTTPRCRRKTAPETGLAGRATGKVLAVDLVWQRSSVDRSLHDHVCVAQGVVEVEAVGDFVFG
jgi:hypothetical protein